MTKKHPQRSIRVLTTYAAINLVLSGGCVPVDGAELGTFVRSLLLKVTAALLL